MSTAYGGIDDLNQPERSSVLGERVLFELLSLQGLSRPKKQHSQKRLLLLIVA